MLLLVRLLGSKAIIHNSPFQNPVVLLCDTKATENMEYNLMDYHFFSCALWHNDTITLKLIFKAGKRGLGDRKIRRIIRSLVFKFDKLTGLRRNHFLVLSVMLQRVGRALYTVATGHCCRTDELSDNNWVKRGNKWCHECMKWKESTDLFSKTIHARANQSYWEVLCRRGWGYVCGGGGWGIKLQQWFTWLCHEESLYAPKTNCSTTRSYETLNCD